MKPSEAAEIVMMLIAAYPNARITPSTSAVYESALADLDAPNARQAVTRLLATSKWLPTIAEIRSAATDLRLGPARTGEEAYAIVAQAIRRVGQYQRVTFHDPLIERALGIWGGWTGACLAPEDDPGGRARFIELYDSLAARERDAEASGIPLPAPKSRPRPIAPPRAAPELTPAPMPALATVPRPRGPERPHRRYTADELDAALAGGEARA